MGSLLPALVGFNILWKNQLLGPAKCVLDQLIVSGIVVVGIAGMAIAVHLSVHNVALVVAVQVLGSWVAVVRVAMSVREGVSRMSRSSGVGIGGVGGSNAGIVVAAVPVS